MSEAMQPETTKKKVATGNKRLWQLWFATLVLVLIAGAYLAFSVVGKQNPTTEAPILVKVTASGYNPSTISIKKGAAVTWVNDDSAEHRLMGDQTELGMSTAESLQSGDSYSYTFGDKGTFTYHDPLAPTSFKGTVIVE